MTSHKPSRSRLAWLEARLRTTRPRRLGRYEPVGLRAWPGLRIGQLPLTIRMGAGDTCTVCGDVIYGDYVYTLTADGCGRCWRCYFQSFENERGN